PGDLQPGTALEAAAGRFPYSRPARQGTEEVWAEGRAKAVPVLEALRAVTSDEPARIAAFLCSSAAARQARVRWFRFSPFGLACHRSLVTCHLSLTLGGNLANISMKEFLEAGVHFG